MGTPPVLSEGLLPKALSEYSITGAPLVVQVKDVGAYLCTSDAHVPSGLVVSDGKYSCHALLADGVEDAGACSAIKRGTVLQVNKLTKLGAEELGRGQASASKLLLIILDLEVLSHLAHTIGNPVLLTDTLPVDAQSSTAAATAVTWDHDTTAEAAIPSAAQLLGDAGSSRCATADSVPNRPLLVQEQSSFAATAAAIGADADNHQTAAAKAADMSLSLLLSDTSTSSSSSSALTAAAVGAEVYSGRPAPAQSAAAAAGTTAAMATPDSPSDLYEKAVRTEAIGCILQLMSDLPPLGEVVAQLCAVKAGTNHEKLVFVDVMAIFVKGVTPFSNISTGSALDRFAMVYSALLHPDVFRRDEAMEMRVLNRLRGHDLEVGLQEPLQYIMPHALSSTPPRHA